MIFVKMSAPEIVDEFLLQPPLIFDESALK